MKLTSKQSVLLIGIVSILIRIDAPAQSIPPLALEIRNSAEPASPWSGTGIVGSTLDLRVSGTPGTWICLFYTLYAETPVGASTDAASYVASLIEGNTPAYPFLLKPTPTPFMGLSSSYPSLVHRTQLVDEVVIGRILGPLDPEAARRYAQPVLSSGALPGDHWDIDPENWVALNSTLMPQWERVAVTVGDNVTTLDGVAMAYSASVKQSNFSTTKNLINHSVATQNFQAYGMVEAMASGLFKLDIQAVGIRSTFAGTGPYVITNNPMTTVALPGLSIDPPNFAVTISNKVTMTIDIGPRINYINGGSGVGSVKPGEQFKIPFATFFSPSQVSIQTVSGTVLIPATFAGPGYAWITLPLGIAQGPARILSLSNALGTTSCATSTWSSFMVESVFP